MTPLPFVPSRKKERLSADMREFSLLAVLLSHDTQRVAGANPMRAFRILLLLDLLMKGTELRPVHLRAVVMLGVIAVTEPEPVIEAVMAADTPGDWNIGVAIQMLIIAVEGGQAVPQIIK